MIRFAIINWKLDRRTKELRERLERAQAAAAQKRADDAIERVWRERVDLNIARRHLAASLDPIPTFLKRQAG